MALASYIGVVCAIAGNICISVALNIQKHVHNSLADVESQSLLDVTSEAHTAKYTEHRLWWLGMLVMLIGELGNFAAYGFAPAVLVAPLGTVALVLIADLD